MVVVFSWPGSSHHRDLYDSFVSAFCSGLMVGDWRELEQGMDAIQADRFPPLIAVLVNRGQCGLMQLAREEYSYEPATEGYTGKCHLGADVRRHLVKTGEFEEPRPQGSYGNP